MPDAAPIAPPPTTAPPAPIPDKVAVRLADGRAGTVPGTSLPAVLQQGGHVISPDELHQEDLTARYQGPEGLAIAFANAATKAATFDQLNAGSIPEALGQVERKASQEALKAAEELHPVGSFAGSLAGMALNPVLGEIGAAGEAAGESAFGKGASTALGRIVQRGGTLGARGAAENASLALGQAVADAGEHDTPLTGEKLAAAVGYGALTGFAGGAALGGVGQGLSEARVALSPAMRRAAGVEAARSVMPGHLSGGRLGKEISQKLGKDGMSEIGQELLDRGIVTPGADTELKFTRIRAAREEVGQKIGALLDQVPAVGKPIDVYRLFDEAAEPFAKKAGQEFVAEQLEALRDKVGRQLGIVDEAGNLVEGAEERTVGFEDLLVQRKSLSELLWKDIRTLPDSAKVDLKALRGVERGFEGYLTNIADESEKFFDRPNFREEYRALKSSYQKLVFADDAISDKLAKEGNRRYLSLSDTNMMAGSLSAAAAGHPAALLAGPANKALRQYGPQTAAWAMNRVATMRAIAGEVTSFDRILDRGINAWLHDAREPKEPLFRPVAIGPRMGEPGEMVAAYDEHAAQVKAAIAHPDIAGGVAERMGDFAHHAPQATAAVQQTTARAVAFLATKLPPTPPVDPLRPKQTERPSATQMAKFLRYARAVDDPASVLEDLRARRLTPEAVEGMRTVYPTIFAEVRKKVLNRLQEQDEGLSYQARAQLAQLFDVPAAPTMSPASRAASHAVWSGTGTEGGQASPGPKKSGGSKRVDLGAFGERPAGDTIESNADSGKAGDE